MPPDTDQQSRGGRREAGFLAYWNDLGTRQLYVFDRVLHTRADVGQALLNLEMDLAVDVLTIATADDELTRAVELAVAKPEDATTWTEATPATIRSIMGLPESDPGVTAAASSDPQPTCCLITDPCCTTAEAGIIVSPLPEPLFGAGPDELINSAIQNVNCCPMPPPPPPGPEPPCVGCCCCPLRGLSSAAAGCCLDSVCNDGSFCTIDDRCSGYPGQNCGVSECCGLARDCDDGNPCTADRCDDSIDACVNRPRCAPLTCCPSGEGFFCCPAADMFCCPNSDHCCLSGETCCAAGRCRPDETCCNGACGLKGACCFFDTGSCSELTHVCCAQQGGAYQGDGTVCLPPDLCRPRCENCHTVSAVVYECLHFSGHGPCGTSACIVSTINTATCEFFPSRLGPPNCNTKTLDNEPWMVQEVRGLQDLSCANYQPGDYQVWAERFFGCGSECFENDPIQTRCDTFGCEGALDFRQERRPRRTCGCP